MAIKIGFSKEGLRQLAKIIKEYWVLVTLPGVLLALMISWNELKDYYEQDRQLRYHNSVGVHLLEQGRYKMAKRSFESALRLEESHRLALHASILCDLFIDMSSPDWDPAMGWIVRTSFEDLALEEKLQHIVYKYLGDLYQRIGDLKEAKKNYEKALDVDPKYLDALYTDGWLSYSELPSPDVERMAARFEKMVSVAPYDYRGFHGFGYALYMKAISEDDPERRTSLLEGAAKQSEQAAKFRINQLNVIMDFGEIARAKKPSMALSFHKWAYEVLADPVLCKLEVNQPPYQIRLLKHPHTPAIFLEEENQIRTWIKYQMALDHLAIYSKLHREYYLEEHKRLLKEADSEDQEKKKARLIYDDQKMILGHMINLENVP